MTTSENPILHARAVAAIWQPTTPQQAEVKTVLLEACDYAVHLRHRYVGAMAELVEARRVIAGRSRICPRCKTGGHDLCDAPYLFAPEAGPTGRYVATMCCCGEPV